MRKLLTALIMISISTIMIAKEIDLSKSKGVNQEEIVSLYPTPADNSIKRGANIKITFDKKLKAKAEVINGYTLPPEPDPKINNATLLGVDVNHNGVRDDVERYIIKRFSKDPEFPKTKTAIALQYAWASQKILENPTIDSKKYLDDSIDCQFYWFRIKTKNMTTLNAIQYSVKHEVFDDSEIKDRIYNTRERIQTKFSFNAACSGNIFEGRELSVDSCRTNISEIGE